MLPAMWRPPSVLLLAAAVGALGGAGGTVLSRTLYIPLLMPIAMGVVVGIGLGFLVYLLGVRSRVVGLAAATLAFAACAGAFHYTEYRWSFVPGVRHVLDRAHRADNAGRLPPDQAVAAADAVLMDLVGRPGFLGFLELRLRSGVRLRLRKGQGGAVGWALALWALDLLLLFGLILRLTRGVQRRLPPVVDPPGPGAYNAPAVTGPEEAAGSSAGSSPDVRPGDGGGGG